MVGLAFPLLSSKGDHNPPHTGDTAPFFFNSCYYETVDAPEVLEKYGLPCEITPDLVGAHVAYIEASYDKGFPTFEETSAETDIELHTYAPAPLLRCLCLSGRQSVYGRALLQPRAVRQQQHQL